MLVAGGYRRGRDMKYTEAMHAKNLIKILESADTCRRCPACIGGDDFCTDEDCNICRAFIGLSIGYSPCPCGALGRSLAVKRSWITLEEKGYLE